MIRFGVRGCLLFGTLSAAGGCREQVPAAERDALGASLAEAARVSELGALPGRPVPRAAPVVGPSFGNGFQSAEGARHTLEQAQTAAEGCARRLVAGEPAARVECGTALEPTRAALRELLGLSATLAPGTPPSAHALAPMTSGPGVHRSVIALCARAEAQIELERVMGEPGTAGLTCAQALEVSRDYAMRGSLVGAMAVASCVTRVGPACGRALAASNDADRAARRRDLSAVASSLPAFAEFVAMELVGVQVPLCGWAIAPAARGTLGPLAKTATDASAAQYESYSPRDRHMAWTLCRSGMDAMQLAVKVFGAPAGSAERARYEAQRRDVISKGAIEGPDLTKLEEKWEAARSTVRGLAD